MWGAKRLAFQGRQGHLQAPLLPVSCMLSHTITNLTYRQPQQA